MKALESFSNLTKEEFKKVLMKVGLRDFEAEIILNIEVENQISYQVDFDAYSSLIIRTSCYYENEDDEYGDFVTEGEIIMAYTDLDNNEDDIFRRYLFGMRQDRKTKETTCFIKEATEEDGHFLF